MPIEKCKSCERYDHERGKTRNKLYCTFSCEEYKTEMMIRAIAYNKGVLDLWKK